MIASPHSRSGSPGGTARTSAVRRDAPHSLSVRRKAPAVAAVAVRERQGESMAHSVRGVVARGKGRPVELASILVPDPGPGEALVRVQACGVCHTDLHYREGGINNDFPFLLGHEAAG